MNDLAPSADITIGGLTLTRTGIQTNGVISLADLTGAARLVSRCATACNWWVGDLLYLALVVPEAGHGMDENTAYQWIAEMFPDMNEEAQQRCLNVAIAFPPTTDANTQNTRFNSLSWTHHRIAARVDGKERIDLLVDAAENDWSTTELRNEVNATLKGPETPSETFEVIPSSDPSEDVQLCHSWREALGAVRASMSYHMDLAVDPLDELTITIRRISPKDKD